MNKYNTLESELSQAIETIQSYKQKELQWNEERAQREKDFMNQMNDICFTMQSKESELMSEIIARDQKIIEMQNQMNEEEMKRILTNEREKCDTTAHAEIQLSEKLFIENNDDDSWSEDEESCEFVKLAGGTMICDVCGMSVLREESRSKSGHITDANTLIESGEVCQ